MSRYQKGKTNLDFTEARDSEWQWHQLSHMQVCTLRQTDRQPHQHPTTRFFTGRMPFLPPNQQRQSTESNWVAKALKYYLLQLHIAYQIQTNWSNLYHGSQEFHILEDLEPEVRYASFLFCSITCKQTTAVEISIRYTHPAAGIRHPKIDGPMPFSEMVSVG